MKNLVLVGFMGSGKSTIGPLVAKKMGMRFVDMDSLIEEREKTTISEIFVKRGESVFREIETELVKELAIQQDLVIATGGGVVLRPSNIEIFGRTGILVYLHVDAQSAFARTQSYQHRPLLKGKESVKKIGDLLLERASFYDAIPYRVETVGYSPNKIAETIVDVYRVNAAKST